MPIEEWIKMWYILTMEYYSATEKDEIMPPATTWVDLEIIMISEVRERQVYDIIHIWNLIFKVTFILFAIVVIHSHLGIHILTNSIGGFSFLHTLSNIYYYFLYYLLN